MWSINGNMVPSVGFSSRSNALDLWWDVTINVEDLNGFLQNLSGSDSGFPLFVRDSQSDFGWRPWTDDHSSAFGIGFPPGSRNSPTGVVTSASIRSSSPSSWGVSVLKVTEWLRRGEYPLPHNKNGRVILVPAFIFKEWMREEPTRSVGGYWPVGNFPAVFPGRTPNLLRILTDDAPALGVGDAELVGHHPGDCQFGRTPVSGRYFRRSRLGPGWVRSRSLYLGSPSGR